MDRGGAKIFEVNLVVHVCSNVRRHIPDNVVSVRQNAIVLTGSWPVVVVVMYRHMGLHTAVMGGGRCSCYLGTYLYGVPINQGRKRERVSEREVPSG